MRVGHTKLYKSGRTKRYLDFFGRLPVAVHEGAELVVAQPVVVVAVVLLEAVVDVAPAEPEPVQKH